MTHDLLAPDTPLPVLSDWAEEHAPDYGLHAERNGDGQLILTVPARADGLPDWETFLKVGKMFRGADGWRMEGAEPLTHGCWFIELEPDWPLTDCDINSKHTIPDCISHINQELHNLLHVHTQWDQGLANLSRACVEWTRA